MSSKRISILGCGWLGLPLAISLIKDGWTVKGSTTSPDKVNRLKENNIEPYLIDLNKQIELIESDFLDSDYLIFNLPPSKLNAPLEQYQRLSSIIQHRPIQKIIFISSTSAYSNTNGISSENDTIHLPDDFNNTIRFERIFQKLNKEVNIIRFGGLIGPQRHPARFFSKGRSITNPNTPVNLIHLDDCIAIIKLLLDSEQWNEIYNACANTHPSKYEFYNKAFEKLGYPKPSFILSDKKEEGKTVSNLKLRSQLGYQFKHPDLLTLLDKDCF